MKKLFLLPCILGVMLSLLFLTGCAAIDIAEIPEPYWPSSENENGSDDNGIDYIKYRTGKFCGIEKVSDIPIEPIDCIIPENRTEGDLVIAECPIKYNSAFNFEYLYPRVPLSSAPVNIDFEGDGIMETIWYLDKTGFLIFSDGELFDCVPFDPNEDGELIYSIYGGAMITALYVLDIDPDDGCYEFLIMCSNSSIEKGLQEVSELSIDEYSTYLLKNKPFVYGGPVNPNLKYDGLPHESDASAYIDMVDYFNALDTDLYIYRYDPSKASLDPLRTRDAANGQIFTKLSNLGSVFDITSDTFRILNNVNMFGERDMACDVDIEYHTNITLDEMNITNTYFEGLENPSTFEWLVQLPRGVQAFFSFVDMDMNLHETSFDLVDNCYYWLRGISKDRSYIVISPTDSLQNYNVFVNEFTEPFTFAYHFDYSDLYYEDLYKGLFPSTEPALTRMDFTCEKLTENGTEEVTIPLGTLLYPVQTDLTGYVKFTDSSGNLYQAEVYITDEAPTVNTNVSGNTNANSYYSNDIYYLDSNVLPPYCVFINGIEQNELFFSPGTALFYNETSSVLEPGECNRLIMD